MKRLYTKTSKKGSPLNYFYMNDNDYPFKYFSDITVEEETKNNIEFMSLRQPLFLHKNRNFKNKDIIYFPQPNTYGVSQRFKSIFEKKLKAVFIQTIFPEYYLMIVNNVIDNVNKEMSIIEYYDKERRATYNRLISKIILDENIVKDELLFSIPEEPLKTLCTEKFIKMCEHYKIKNVVFDDFKC